MSRKIIITLIAVLFSLHIGCVPKQYMVNPDFANLSREINNPILAHPTVKVYELTAGGVRELKQEWCDISYDNIVGSVLDNLEGVKCQIMGDEISPELEEKIEDLRALYAAVSYSINLHATNQQSPHAFPHKIENFDYTVGPIDDILEELGADGIVLVYGSDEISTGGRQALMAVGMIVGAAVGGGYAGPRVGVTSVHASIINPDGKIIWYSSKVSAGEHDLRKKESTDKIIQQLFLDFPRLGT
jgi:DNA-binding PadR family transcriptional regulator